MEVWGIQSHGAANTLYEILTMKADDQVGRYKLDEYLREPQTHKPAEGPSKWFSESSRKSVPVPESFRVLMSELRALGINVPTK